MPDCSTCGVVICGDTLGGGSGGIDPLDLFSLQAEIFPFVIFCPEGSNCEGLSSFSMNCCGQVFTTIFPENASLEQRIQQISDVLRQCVTASQSCAGGGSSPGGATGAAPSTPQARVTGTVANQPPSQSNPFRIYYNRPQTATSTCPDGGVSTYRVAAGEFAGLSQASADAAAKAYAAQRAPLLKICLSYPRINYCRNVAADIEFQATGGGLGTYPAGDQWEVVSGSIPTGMVFNGGFVTWPGKSGTSKASITGTPSAAGVFMFTLKVTGPGGQSQSRTYSLAVVEITPATIPATIVCDPFSEQLTLQNAIGTVEWSVTVGSLPDGLSLDSATGEISGTPTQVTTANFTVSASIEDGTTCSKAYTLAVEPGSCFSNGNPPNADTTPQPYSFTLVPIEPLVPGESFSILSGSLPPGITLNATTGEISGSTTTPGSYSFTAGISGRACACEDDYTIVAECQPSVSDVAPGNMGTLNLTGPGTIALTPVLIIQRTGAGKTLNLESNGTVGSRAGLNTEWGIRLYDDQTNTLLATLAGDTAFGGPGVGCNVIPYVRPSGYSLTSCLRYRLEPYITVTGANPDSCTTSMNFTANWA